MKRDVWLPIDAYDKRKTKIKEKCVFWFKATPMGKDCGGHSRGELPATLNLARHMGSRECTHFKIIGQPEVQP